MSKKSQQILWRDQDSKADLYLYAASIYSICFPFMIFSVQFFAVKHIGVYICD